MKLLARLLIVLGIVAIIPGGISVVRDLTQARSHDSRIAELRENRKKILAELHEVNLEFRGYQQSIPTIPDSIKKAQSGIISQTFRDYNKRVRSLEMQEQDAKRLMGREEFRKSEVLADTALVGGGLGGGGLVLIALGLMLRRRASA